MRRSLSITKRVLAALSLLLTVGLFAAPSAYAKDTVRVGLWSWPGYGFLHVAQKMNLAPDLDLKFTIVEDPVQLFALASTGKLDVVLSTIEYGPIAAAQGMPVKVAALTNLGNGSDHIIVRPDIKKISDLKGKKVAVLEGGLSQIYLAIWLQKHGIKWNEVKMVNLIAADATAAMISGQVAAAELWDPYAGQVLKQLKGSRELSNSAEPYWLKLGLIADALYVTNDFATKRHATAVKLTKALFAGVEYWRKHPIEANKIIAKAIGFKPADVTPILGGKNNPKDGTLYMYSLKQAAQFCGVAPGQPPFGQHNGQIADHWKLTNKWWRTFGLMKKTIPPAKGINCSLLKDAMK